MRSPEPAWLGSVAATSGGPASVLASTPRALTRGDVATLYEDHRDDVYRFAVLVAGDPPRAEDAVQEAFARLYRDPGRVRSPDRALAYVRSIVVNLLRTPPRLAPPPGPASPDHDSTEQTVLALDEQACVTAALASLSMQQRACIVCRYYLDMSDPEVADTLGVSLGTAKTHMRRALRHLRTLLGEHHGS